MKLTRRPESGSAPTPKNPSVFEPMAEWGNQKEIGVEVITFFGVRGFTLLEMLISIGIFSVVIVSAISVLISIQAAQRKAANIQSVQDNIRFALEIMTKELRQGFQYHVPNPLICDSFNGRCGSIEFIKADGSTVGYCMEWGVIRRTAGGAGCSSGSPMTSEDIEVTSLQFYYVGLGVGPNAGDGQPRLTISLAGHAKDAPPKASSSFQLQTTITQRLRDL